VEERSSPPRVVVVLALVLGIAAANDLVGKSNAEVREAIGDKFPKHIYHSIVCIGALVAHREPDHWAVDAVGVPPCGRGHQNRTKYLISVFVGTARFLKVNPVAATMTAKHVDQVSAGQQRNRFIAGKRIGVWAVVTRRD
jgi:hypothetical protein